MTMRALYPWAMTYGIFMDHGRRSLSVMDVTTGRFVGHG
jgi:hypothetical protein